MVPVGMPCVENPTGQGGGIAGGVTEVAIAGNEADRDPRDPEDGGLERTGDRSRVGDVITEVGAMVDTRDDYVRALGRIFVRARVTQSVGVPSTV
jgi:hypothetical protein